jgi:hypothetical protein
MDGGLRSLFRKHLPQVDWLSVETAMTEGGVPDANGCVDGKEFWVEFKATRAWAVRVRPAQVGWIERRLRHGGRVFVAVRRQHASGSDELWLIQGGAVRGLRDYGLRCAFGAMKFGTWDGGPTAWNWAEVLRAMKS